MWLPDILVNDTLQRQLCFSPAVTMGTFHQLYYLFPSSLFLLFKYQNDIILFVYISDSLIFYDRYFFRNYLALQVSPIATNQKWNNQKWHQTRLNPKINAYTFIWHKRVNWPNPWTWLKVAFFLFHNRLIQIYLI